MESTQQAILLPSDLSSLAQFGVSVAISSNGQYAIVGSNQGEKFHDARPNYGVAYIYVLIDGTWSQQDKLVASDYEVGDDFGRSVSISSDGSYVIIGAPKNYIGGFGDKHQGAAYIFTRSGTSWSQQEILGCGDGVGYSEFGYSVNISSDGLYASVGAPRENTPTASDAGAVYIYVRSDTSWSLQQKLMASDATYGNCFGWSCSISGDGSRVAIGDPIAKKHYIFSRTASTWSQLEFGSSTQYGYASSIDISDDGEYVVIGLPCSFKFGQKSYLNNTGAAYVDKIDGIGGGYLYADDATQEDYFGWSVSISSDGSLVVVGAGWCGVRWQSWGDYPASEEYGPTFNPEDLPLCTGSAYFFERKDSNTWTQQDKVYASSGGNGQGFGYSVAMSSNGLFSIIGAIWDAMPGMPSVYIDTSISSGSVTVFVNSATAVVSPTGLGLTWSVVEPTATIIVLVTVSPVAVSWSTPEVVSPLIETATISPVSVSWVVVEPIVIAIAVAVVSPTSISWSVVEPISVTMALVTALVSPVEVSWIVMKPQMVSPTSASWSVVEPTAIRAEFAIMSPVFLSWSVIEPTWEATVLVTSLVSPIEVSWIIIEPSYVELATAVISPTSVSWSVVEPTAIPIELATMSPASISWWVVEPFGFARKILTSLVSPIEVSWIVIEPSYVELATAVISPTSVFWSVVEPTAIWAELATMSPAPISWLVVEPTGTIITTPVAKIDPISTLWSIVEPIATINYDLDFTTDKEFVFNVGECVPYYWQVESICQKFRCIVWGENGWYPLYYNDNEIATLDCDRKQIVVIMACSLKELCEKLVERGFTEFYNESSEISNIGRIVRYTQPALTRHQENYFDGCGNYIEVFPGTDPHVLQQIPECLPFVLTGDEVTEWGIETSVEWAIAMDEVGDIEITAPGSFETSSYAQSEIGDIEIDVEGEMDATNYLGEFVSNVAFYVQYSDLMAVFQDDDGEDLDESTDVVQEACECELVPVVIEVKHNLNNTNKLSQFLTRNGLQISTTLRSIYNSGNQSWQVNQHYSGVGEDGNSTENWTILMEWACVSDVGGVDVEAALGVWKFSLYIKRNNITMGEDSDTRILMAFIPEEVCPPGQNLAFSFMLNTETHTIVETTTVSNINGQINVCFDNIGLFKSPEWSLNPYLKIEISQQGVGADIPRLDISQIIPKDVLLYRDVLLS